MAGAVVVVVDEGEYVRVSSDEQAEGLSLQSQQEKIRERRDNCGFELINWKLATPEETHEMLRRMFESLYVGGC